MWHQLYLLPSVVNHEIMSVEKYRCHQDDHFFCIEMGDTLFRIVYKLCSAKPFSCLQRLAHFTQAVKFLGNDIRFQKCNCLHQSQYLLFTDFELLKEILLLFAQMELGALHLN